MDEYELLVSEANDEGDVTAVIRPAAILPEEAARSVLMELSLRDVRVGGGWYADPSVWRRYDRPWDGVDGTPGSAQLIGTIQVAYGTPTRYDITIFRATITSSGMEQGWSVARLCEEALGYAGLSLSTCPRADLKSPPRPFRFTGVPPQA